MFLLETRNNSPSFGSSQLKHKRDSCPKEELSFKAIIGSKGYPAEKELSFKAIIGSKGYPAEKELSFKAIIGSKGYPAEKELSFKAIIGSKRHPTNKRKNYHSKLLLALNVTRPTKGRTIIQSYHWL